MRISDWSSDVCSSDLLADTAPLGAWSVEARVDRDGEPLGRLGFHVEEFIPERLKIELAADAPALHPDRPVTVTATARFLYGPPAADLDGSAEMTRSEEHTSELQSLMRISYAVFCLKKKTTKPIKHITKQKQ